MPAVGAVAERGYSLRVEPRPSPPSGKFRISRRSRCRAGPRARSRFLLISGRAGPVPCLLFHMRNFAQAFETPVIAQSLGCRSHTILPVARE